MKKGTLYIVATPIGNMGDITKRAVEVLSTVDFVACEDTRVSGNLLKNLGIKESDKKNKLISIHQHSSDEKIGYIIRLLKEGKDVAYVSDNGTPGISDPGQKLIAAIRYSERSEESQRFLAGTQDEIKIIPLPGASALTAAVSVWGLVEKEFYFAGFLPKKKGRETKMKWLQLLDCPIVIYETAIRLEKTLNDIKKFLGEEAEIFIAREITKKFEEYWGGNVVDLIADLKNHQIKGEFVLIVKNLPK